MKYYFGIHNEIKEGRHRKDITHYNIEDVKEFQSCVDIAKSKVASIKDLLADKPAMIVEPSPAQETSQIADPSPGQEMFQMMGQSPVPTIHIEPQAPPPSVAPSLQTLEQSEFDIPFMENSSLEIHQQSMFDQSPTKTPYFAPEEPAEMEQQPQDTNQPPTRERLPDIAKPKVNRDLLKLNISEVARIREKQAKEKETRAKIRAERRMQQAEEKKAKDSAPQ